MDQNFIFKLLDDDTYCVTAYDGDKDPIIPDTYQGAPITIIADDVFSGRVELSSVSIPDTVTDIGSFVFDGCYSLKTVRLPSGLQNMWQYAFARSGIEQISIPEGVRNIVPFTFFRCPRLRRVEIPKTVTEIYANAFKDCPNLTEVILPRDCKIHELAFDGCPKVPFIYI